MVWYSHLLKSLPQFVMIYTVKGYSVVHETKIEVFLKFPCFFYNPAIVGNLIPSSSSFSKPSLNIWQVYWDGLPFPPPVDHIFSGLSVMTHPSWMVLNGMANNFIELCQPLYHNKAVILEGADSVIDSQISVSSPWISLFLVLDVDLGNIPPLFR